MQLKVNHIFKKTKLFYHNLSNGLESRNWHGLNLYQTINKKTVCNGSK
jgi:hypothetical protein